MALWSSTDKENPGLVAEADYDGETHKFVVKVTKGEKVLTETFRAEFEPRFGIDVVDMDTIYKVAERLSDQLK